jgi:hypothetical protein
MSSRERSMTTFFQNIDRIVKDNFGIVDIENDDDSIKCYTILTKYGNMSISYYSKKSIIYNVFCKFEDVELAKKHLDCNPFSGKWNLHISTKLKKIDAEKEVINIITKKLERLKPNL